MRKYVQCSGTDFFFRCSMFEMYLLINSLVSVITFSLRVYVTGKVYNLPQHDQLRPRTMVLSLPPTDSPDPRLNL
jgi:hypothetical protein